MKYNDNMHTNTWPHKCRVVTMGLLIFGLSRLHVVLPEWAQVALQQCPRGEGLALDILT